ncbi:hypothetical protein [Rhodobacter capsulatus]|uniref:hypothetical protein n=1 Tax=Rhodobacter capsulatus TaxID=1061 RepID=UPI004029F514
MFFSVLSRGCRVLFLVLAAFPASAEPRIFLVLGESRDGQIGGALSATLAQFCGPSRCGETWAQAHARAAKSAQGEVFGFEDALPWYRRSSRRIGLGLQADRELSESLAATFTVSAAFGQSRYAFPQGFTRVLSEPGTVGFKTLEIDPTLGLEWHAPVPRSDRFTLRTRLGIGHEIAFIRTRVDNPVLRVRSNATLHANFLELGAALSMPPSHDGAIGLELAFAARGYSGERLTLTTELRFRR